MITRTQLPDLLASAVDHCRGVGAFNVVLLEHAEAIVEGAELAECAVILQISENCIGYHGSLTPIVHACKTLAAAAKVEVIVHLDHIGDPDLIRQGVALGVDSVMIDASRLPYRENVRVTREMADFCHARGVYIEAELGEIGGKDGVHAAGIRTDPHEAAKFVAETDVDSLAVAVGTSHAMSSRIAKVDHALIRSLKAIVPVPLVLHGSSGLSDTELRAAISSGMTKVNISTHLNAVFTKAVRVALSEDESSVDPRTYVGRGRDAAREEVRRLLRLMSKSPA